MVATKIPPPHKNVYEKEVEHLRKQIKNKDSQLSTISSRNAELQRTADGLTEQIASRCSHIKHLEEEKQTILESCKELEYGQKYYKDQVNIIKQLKDEYMEKAQESSDLYTQDITVITQTLTTRTDELKTIKNDLNRLQKESESNYKIIKTREHDKEQLVQKYTQSQKLVVDLKRSLSTTNQQLNEIQQKYQSVIRENKLLQKKTADFKTVLASIKNSLNSCTI